MSSNNFDAINQYEAAESGNLAWFQFHVTNGTLPDLMITDSYGYFPLEYAAEENHLDVVRFILENSNQEIDATANDNQVLRAAADRGRLEIIRYLIEESDQTVDATAQNNDILRGAAVNGHLDIIRYLIEESGQPVNVRVDDHQVLRSAAQFQYLDIVRYLIEDSSQPVNVFAADNALLQIAKTSSNAKLRDYLESAIQMIGAVGLDTLRALGFEACQDALQRLAAASSVPKSRI
jgi:ankyrin repeat protein